MGCYNKTCSLSGLPITAGQSTVLFFIVYNGFNPDSSPVYPATMWTAIPMPFYGKYDDYGYQEMDDGEEWKLEYLDKAYRKYVKEFIQTGSEIAQEVDKSVPVDIFTKGFEEIFERIHRGNFEFRDIYQDKVPRTVSIVMMHRGIYDALISHIIPADFDKTIEQFDKFVEEELSSFDDNAEFMREFHMENIGYEFSKHMKFGWDDPHRLVEGLAYRSGESDGCGLIAKGIARALTTKEQRQKYRPFEIESVAINAIYYRLRKTWMPATGNGSQAGLNETYRALIKAMTQQFNECIERERAWVENPDEEDKARAAYKDDTLRLQYLTTTYKETGKFNDGYH